jgi:glucokinase
MQNQEAQGLIIGVDIGGTKIAAGLVDSTSGDVIQAVKAPTPKDGNESILGAVGELTEQLLQAAPHELIGIGVGIPGFVDREKGIALTASNLNYRNMPVTQYILERFNRLSYMENDTNAGTLGEKWFGCGKGLQHFIYLAIGTGIGGGLIFNGKLYLGRGNAGEIGHMIIEPNGETCVCGTPGCLEALASGSSIARHAIAKLKEGGCSSMCDNLAMEKIITAEGVVNAARAGDSLAMEVMAEAGKALAMNLVSLVRLLDPEAIIIGGGVSQAKDLLSEVILSAIPTARFRHHLIWY